MVGLRLHWACDNLAEIGSATGYSRVQTLAKKALERAGVALDSNSLYALHLCPPFMYKRVQGKLNVLMSMWEANRVPPELVEKTNAADVLLVPCEHNIAAFRDSGCFRPEIRLCPLGIDTDYWTPGETAPQMKPFVFLYAANPIHRADRRKGWERVAQAFQIGFRPHEDVKLYVKFNSDNKERGTLDEHYGGRIIVDHRYVPLDELREIYRAAHVFVYPSRGEGFGFLPAEAMACGALALAPNHTGMANFISSHTAEVLPMLLHKNMGKYGVEIDIYDIDPRILAKQMRRVMTWYTSKPMRARRAAGTAYVRKHHSLEAFGNYLTDSIFSEAVKTA